MTDTHEALPSIGPDQYAEIAAAIETEIGRVIVGQHDVVRAVLTCLLAEGHALLEGVSAVHITGVHPLDDQAVALRLVALTDRLYDAGIPVVASGAKLDTVFSPEMLEGGYRKKYLRATSRLLALSNPAAWDAAGLPAT